MTRGQTKRMGKECERIEGKRLMYVKDAGKEERAFPRQAKQMETVKRTAILFKCRVTFGLVFKN
jgi:predicted GTPase